MTWVKICGITNVEDARVAADAGADALGFVFYERSPRNVDPEKAREITHALGSNLETVGVFVDESPESMISVARRAGLTAIQWVRTGLLQRDRLSLQTSSAGAWPSDLKVYVVVAPAALMWLGSTPPDVAAIFLDSSTPDVPGGTGRTFDWEAAKSLVQEMRRDINIVIAGGLNPENVAKAIQVLQPWGVDVSSGVEIRPGKKDPSKVRTFIQAVRELEVSA